MDSTHEGSGRPKAARFALVLCLVINLGILAFFKYADFIIDNINLIPSVSIPLLGISLPIGVSFYIFQSLSYTIDVYRGDVKAQPNIINFGTYVALFPQLIAGPIVQYKTIDRQLTERTESFDKFGDGVRRFIVGLGKKVLIANSVGIIWTNISSSYTSSVPVLTAWIGILAFTLQIYFDFSGYSDMAIGLGKMFGFEFLENFRYPYMSKSITNSGGAGILPQHMVSRLCTSRRRQPPRSASTAPQYSCCLGSHRIWHGASWNFVLWGLYFGILLVIEKLFLLRLLKRFRL